MEKIRKSLEGERQFKAIFFSHPNIKSPNDFVKAIDSIAVMNSLTKPKHVTITPEKPDIELSDDQFQHAKFFVRCKYQLWVPQENSEGVQVIDDYYDSDTEEYHYPLYLAVFSPDPSRLPQEQPRHKLVPKSIFILISPLASILIIIEKNLHLDGVKIIFHKICLDDVIRDVMKNRSLHPNIIISKFICIPVEKSISQVSLTLKKYRNIETDGKESVIGNLIDTDLFKNLFQNGLVIQKCKILYQNRQNIRFSIESNLFGLSNMYISRDGKNIDNLAYVFQNFIKNNWLESTTTNPVTREPE